MRPRLGELQPLRSDTLILRELASSSPPSAPLQPGADKAMRTINLLQTKVRPASPAARVTPTLRAPPSACAHQRPPHSLHGRRTPPLLRQKPSTERRSGSTARPSVTRPELPQRPSPPFDPFALTSPPPSAAQAPAETFLFLHSGDVARFPPPSFYSRGAPTQGRMRLLRAPPTSLCGVGAVKPSSVRGWLAVGARL